jgi:hypothetical protein
VSPTYLGGGAVFSPLITVAGVTVTATATCTSGSVVGGGYELLGDYLALDVAVVVDRATSSTTWTVTARNRLLVSLLSFGVQAFAVCA